MGGKSRHSCSASIRMKLLFLMMLSHFLAILALSLSDKSGPLGLLPNFVDPPSVRFRVVQGPEWFASGLQEMPESFLDPETVGVFALDCLIRPSRIANLNKGSNTPLFQIASMCSNSSG